jgi:hypothetical protein
MCSFFYVFEGFISHYLFMIWTDLSERVKRVENMRNLLKI